MKPANEVQVWAPATVANLNVGFDALGCALQGLGERLVARSRPAVLEGVGRVTVQAVHGADLSLVPSENVAAVAGQSLLDALGGTLDIELTLYKSIIPGSGLGTSASSAAAAVVAVNELMGAGLSAKALLPYALDGEALASGARHADNVAPALLGGLVLCPPQGEPIRLPVPEGWHWVLLHPHVEISTKASRMSLPQNVSLCDAVAQAGWLASFVDACHRDEAGRAADCMEDVLVGPGRQHMIPHFDEVRRVAFNSGARSGGIAGSGPSTFWITTGAAQAAHISEALGQLMRQLSISHTVCRATPDLNGARLIHS